MSRLLAASLLLLPISTARRCGRKFPPPILQLRILLLLAVTVGGPYLLLSATAPLLQRWFTLGERRSPWRLYALSNFGSFLALLGYPFVFEPYLRLRTQGGCGRCCMWCSWRRADGWRGGTRARRSARYPGTWQDALRASPRTRLLFWLGLSTCGSIAVSHHQPDLAGDRGESVPVGRGACDLSADVHADIRERPLVPARHIRVRRGSLAPVTCVLASRLQRAFRCGCNWGCTRLPCSSPACYATANWRDRALQPRYFTAFYLTIAAGGALGGVFVAMIAPRVFTEFSEYPIGLAGACLLGFLGWLRSGALRRMDSPQSRRCGCR